MVLQIAYQIYNHRRNRNIDKGYANVAASSFETGVSKTGFFKSGLFLFQEECHA